MRFGLQLETYTPENGEYSFDWMRTVARLAVGVEYVIVELLDAGEIEPVRLFARTVLPAFLAT